MFNIKLGGLVAGFVCTTAAYYRVFAIPLKDAHNAHMKKLEETEDRLLAAQQSAVSAAPLAIRGKVGQETGLTTAAEEASTDAPKSDALSPSSSSAPAAAAVPTEATPAVQ